jgi:phosphoribosyl-ATP pyrophosphohydrolase
MSDFTLDQLAATIAERHRAGNAATSYTAKLIDKGIVHCAKKFGEEAVEAALAAVKEDDQRLAAEAGDVLYHLLVMLEARGVPLAAVMDALAQRTAQGGLAEKASRKDR